MSLTPLVPIIQPPSTAFPKLGLMFACGSAYVTISYWIMYEPRDMVRQNIPLLKQTKNIKIQFPSAQNACSDILYILISAVFGYH